MKWVKADFLPNLVPVSITGLVWKNCQRHSTIGANRCYFQFFSLWVQYDECSFEQMTLYEIVCLITFHMWNLELCIQVLYVWYNLKKRYKFFKNFLTTIVFVKINLHNNFLRGNINSIYNSNWVWTVSNSKHISCICQSLASTILSTKFLTKSQLY